MYAGILPLPTLVKEQIKEIVDSESTVHDLLARFDFQP